VKYVLIGAASFLLMSGTAAAVSFPDVGDNHWAKDEISFLKEEGVIQGHKDGTFRPNDPVTRAQTADMLVDAFDLDTGNSPPAGYPDVKEGDYAYEEILAVTEEGWMQGYGTNFGPRDALKRGQMAAVLTRAFELEMLGPHHYFTDVSDDNYYFDYIRTIASHGIAIGYPDQTFRSGSDTTRAEFSTFLARAMNPEEFVEGYIDAETQKELINAADEFVEALAEEDMETAASKAAEELRFSPYSYLDEEDQIFTNEETAGLWEDDTVYHWGYFDGTGDDIEMTYQDYHERFVYSRDYVDADIVSINQRQGGSSTIDNSADVYPGQPVVEYHMEATDNELNWRSLRLVMVEENGEWVVEAVINDEWTT
jgi:hypothetical protein